MAMLVKSKIPYFYSSSNIAITYCFRQFLWFANLQNSAASDKK